MGKMTARWCLLLLFGLALTACSSSGKVDEVEANIVPTKYKQEVIDTLTPLLSDPTNLRDGAISEPALTTVGKETRYTVCVRYNPRDANQRYIGRRRARRLFLRRPP